MNHLRRPRYQLTDRGHSVLGWVIVLAFVLAVGLLAGLTERPLW